MDTTHLAQTVSWLDEQRRVDKQEISRLQQMMENLLGGSQEQARRIQELEGRLAHTVSQLTRFTKIEESVEQAKVELASLIEGSEARLRAEQRESDRARLAERESVGRALSEIRKELGRFTSFEEDLQARRAEDQRLSEATLTLRQGLLDARKDIEARTRAIPFIEEQRAQDTKRVSELQATTTDLLKRTEAFTPKVAMLEERVRKTEQRTETLLTVHTEIRQAQMRFSETQDLRDQDRKRQMATWDEAMEQQRALIAEYGKQMQRYAEFYEQNRQALASLEQLQTHLMQRQGEAAEMQRVEGERLKKVVEEWQAEYERRWKHKALEVAHAWAEQGHVNKALADKLTVLDKAVEENQRFAQKLWDADREWLARQLSLWQSWQSELDLRSAPLAKPGSRE